MAKRNDYAFLPRLTLRHFARETYRLAMMTGRTHMSKVVNGVSYTFNVDFGLHAVFADWTAPCGASKSASVAIAKSWL